MDTSWFQDLGVVGVLAGALIFTLRYLTTSLSRDIQIQHDIVVKLIDKINKLKDSVDAVYHTQDGSKGKRRWK
tara:strand:+ start:42605 stop:42823 length:219 start_codon:yes stop_codon:yes gene_type:complete